MSSQRPIPRKLDLRSFGAQLEYVVQQYSRNFADALALVRKELWAQEETFYGSPADTETVKVPRAFMERLTDTLCYTA